MATPGSAVKVTSVPTARRLGSQVVCYLHLHALPALSTVPDYSSEPLLAAILTGSVVYTFLFGLYDLAMAGWELIREDLGLHEASAAERRSA
jgi:hypothetical protein